MFFSVIAIDVSMRQSMVLRRETQANCKQAFLPQAVWSQQNGDLAG